MVDKPRVHYGPVRNGFLGPYREVCIPIEEPRVVPDMPKGASAVQLYEVRRQDVETYEEALGMPEEEVFGE